MKELNIYERLTQVRAMVGSVSKSAKNPFFKSSYADLNSVMKTLAPALVEANIIYTQYPNIVDGADVLTTELVNTTNPEDRIVSHTRLVLAKNDMQAYGSAITYSRRYALISMFGLEAVDDEDDFDAASDIYDFAKKEGFTQVCDFYDQLFEA